MLLSDRRVTGATVHSAAGRVRSPIVGHFVAEGGAPESEIWMDRAISQSVFRRTSTVSVARVKLASNVDVQALNQHLAADPRLTSTLIPEQEFFAAQSASRAALIDAFAYLIAGIMALGSVFGALGHDVHRRQPALGRDRDPPRARFPSRSGGRVGSGRGDRGCARRGSPGRRRRVRNSRRLLPHRRSTRPQASSWPLRSG